MMPEDNAAVEAEVQRLAKGTAVRGGAREAAMDELRDHLAEAAGDHAEARGSDRVGVVDVRQSIDALGGDAAVQATFFGGPSRGIRLPQGMAIGAGVVALLSIMWGETSQFDCQTVGNTTSCYAATIGPTGLYAVALVLGPLALALSMGRFSRVTLWVGTGVYVALALVMVVWVSWHHFASLSIGLALAAALVVAAMWKEHQMQRILGGA